MALKDYVAEWMTDNDIVINQPFLTERTEEEYVINKTKDGKSYELSYWQQAGQWKLLNDKVLIEFLAGRWSVVKNIREEELNNPPMYSKYWYVADNIETEEDIADTKISSAVWRGTVDDLMRKNCGNIFISEEAATAGEENLMGNLKGEN